MCIVISEHWQLHQSVLEQGNEIMQCCIQLILHPFPIFCQRLCACSPSSQIRKETSHTAHHLNSCFFSIPARTMQAKAWSCAHMFPNWLAAQFYLEGSPIVLSWAYLKMFMGLQPRTIVQKTIVLVLAPNRVANPPGLSWHLQKLALIFKWLLKSNPTDVYRPPWWNDITAVTLSGCSWCELWSVGCVCVWHHTAWVLFTDLLSFWAQLPCTLTNNHVYQQVRTWSACAQSVKDNQTEVV